MGGRVTSSSWRRRTATRASTRPGSRFRRAPDESPRVLDPIRLAPGFSLSGRVVDPQGRPVAGAWVEIRGPYALRDPVRPDRRAGPFPRPQPAEGPGQPLLRVRPAVRDGQVPRGRHRRRPRDPAPPDRRGAREAARRRRPRTARDRQPGAAAAGVRLDRRQAAQPGRLQGQGRPARLLGHLVRPLHQRDAEPGAPQAEIRAARRGLPVDPHARRGHRPDPPLPRIQEILVHLRPG